MYEELVNTLRNDKEWATESGRIPDWLIARLSQAADAIETMCEMVATAAKAAEGGNMSKAVLISIRPKWCDLIESGKKTLEIRKAAPKLPTPFKCYIYQCLPKSGDWNERDGRVIGEFVCHNIFPLSFYASDASFFDTEPPMDVPRTCLTDKEIVEYLGNGKTGYGWLISNLVIYDKPKELCEFKRWNRTEKNAPCAHTKWLYEPCDTCKECNLTRPPQSWCYVEEQR